jgi:NAD(P)-dependent dehydrogenase (short-subunit alcohol dehydrogenase family)
MAMRGAFTDKIVLVTGAGSGIGRATALAFRDAGARLVVCDVQEARVQDVARELGAACVLSRQVDVAKRDSMKDFADAVHERFGAVDILVNNAGVGLSATFLDTSLDDWDWIVSINMWGVIHGCHYFVPKMVERGQGGHVVNVSSILGLVGLGGTNAYCTTKFAVVGMSESLRAELAPHRIGVSAICPGIIKTDIIRAGRFRTTDANADQRRDAVDARYRQRNFPPEGVAKAILDAVRRDRDLVPVAPEAWSLYYMKRIAPRVGAGVSALLARVGGNG